jgi:Uma2 family endonuclease
MSTATLHPPRTVRSSERLLTVADLAVMPTSLPSGDVRYELDDGRLVTMAPPGYFHGRQQTDIAFELKSQAEKEGLGVTCTEASVILRRDPDRVVVPDVMFILKDSLPPKLSPEGYLETIPEIVVEVRSKNDTPAEVQSKIGEYLEAGVREVWAIDRTAKTIAVHSIDGNVRMLRVGDTLTCGLLPALSMSLNEYYAGV